MTNNINDSRLGSMLRDETNAQPASGWMTDTPMIAYGEMPGVYPPTVVIDRAELELLRKQADQAERWKAENIANLNRVAVTNKSEFEFLVKQASEDPEWLSENLETINRIAMIGLALTEAKAR